jgi:hypothetical protein
MWLAMLGLANLKNPAQILFLSRDVEAGAGDATLSPPKSPDAASKAKR